MENLNLKCKSCGAPIKAEDVHLEQQYAVCAYCGTVFGPSAGKVRWNAPQKERPRPSEPLPQGMQIDTDITGLRIAYRWFGLKTLGLLFFAVMWDGILLVWYGAALSSHAPTQMLLFGGLHVLVGVFVTYQVLTGFLNTTTVRAYMGRLTVRHGPLPWPGNRDLDTDTLEQLYVKQRISYSRRGGRTITYHLLARLRAGKDITLISNVSNANQALYLEQELERYLSIQDRPMPDEYKR